VAKQPKNPAEKPKPATGRPKKPDSETRKNTLKIRLTLTERDILETAATGVSLEVSSWARSVLLREARRLAGENPPQ
jgi:hypothetical protein